MSALHSPRQNHLLAALPEAVYERLLPHLALVHPRGVVAHEPLDALVEHVVRGRSAVDQAVLTGESARK